MEGLDDYSRGFAEDLFGALPRLRESAKVEEHGTLLVELSPGRERLYCDFWLSTAGGEVTVGFGMFHAHFDWPPFDSSTPGLDPIAFVRSLIEDETLIEDWTLSGEWTGSSTLSSDEEPDLTNLEPDHVIYIRSWSGKRDRIIKGA